MAVSTLIREARERAHLSQDELAARAGTSQPAVSHYESGARVPSISTLERLLAAAGARLELTAPAADRTIDVRHGRLAKVRDNRAAIKEAARRHGARNVAVFGSVVRGEDGPGSDVDILVDMDVRTVGLFPLIRLERELSEILDERVDVAVREILADHVAPRAVAEAVPL